ncbi:MAG: disulfide bond formation protein B, partial [Alphaproteobacteria bacterium]|nr:disulfide bond formation protein B [Alphaproteobacteria bacterium]
MLTSLSPRNALLLLLVVSIATIAGAWIFEAAGYLPCELCLMQRWAYYAAIPLTAVLLVAAPLQRAGLYLLALLWIGSMIFGIFHSGVEWKWWA